MLDLKVLRNQPERVREGLQKRNADLSVLDDFAKIDDRRRELITMTEQLKSQRNHVSREIAQKKKAKEDADDLVLEMRKVGDQIKQYDDEIRQLDEDLAEVLLSIPNIPHESVPIGTSEEENVVLHHWGEVKTLDFEPKAHWDLAQELDLLDFERAAKVTGSRFVFYKGLGAKLERALMSFMLDLHTEEHGYTEMIPPFIVNANSLKGTGQFPKFKEDVFALADTNDYYLIPTAEVPLTNYHADEILAVEELPKYYAAFSANFRSEAGSAGRDTRGLIRQHQFNKIELVKIVHPEESYTELEKLLANAERVLQKLELPYRVASLCTGDTGFASAKTYDLEVWMPSAGTYREISSCSNFEDFQARRANLRFRPDTKAKPEFVHTLNGSGLAIGRTTAAIIENFQQADGAIRIPEVLRPYLGSREYIGK
ncbi:seryl-tRNA synthetase [Thermoactinomyces sp. DSM 45891]|uniref:serine--tRNA ligase n=1 Tax=Thermoactinomyces sp. DSM 45891 TaxID=1761907 RepID=UPI0009126DE7|nr:serine--tRNA ligase [Thermoactinomyces sp. DSM 45891]SFX31359.1 seryl-tRNA synthetase [Thermoactinomyces sp. DSM 45891]